MRIKIIIAQYPQSYPGQYMPNVVDAWDEFTLEDNWEGFETSLKKHEALALDGTYEGVRVLDVIVPDASVLALFQTPTVEGQVVSGG